MTPKYVERGVKLESVFNLNNILLTFYTVTF